MELEGEATQGEIEGEREGKPSRASNGAASIDAGACRSLGTPWLGAEKGARRELEAEPCSWRPVEEAGGSREEAGDGTGRSAGEARKEPRCSGAQWRVLGAPSRASSSAVTESEQGAGEKNRSAGRRESREMIKAWSLDEAPGCMRWRRNIRNRRWKG